VGGPASAPKFLGLDPTTEIGGPVGDLNQTAVAVSNGVQFYVVVEGDSLDVRLEADKAGLPTGARRPLPTARLPLSTSGTQDGTRAQISRALPPFLQGQSEPVLQITRDLHHRAALAGHHSGAFGMFPQEVVEHPTIHAPAGGG
jgi:hypothetical protein